MEEQILEILRKLPKYFEYKGIRYSLIIYKNDWEGHDYAWKIYYAKEIHYGFSQVKPLISIQGPDFESAVLAINVEVSKFRAEHHGDPNLTRQ